MWFLANQDESVIMLAEKIGLPEEVLHEAMKTMVYPESLYCDVDSMHIMAKSLVRKNMITGMEESGVGNFIAGLYSPGFLKEACGEAL